MNSPDAILIDKAIETLTQVRKHLSQDEPVPVELPVNQLLQSLQNPQFQWDLATMQQRLVAVALFTDKNKPQDYINNPQCNHLTTQTLKQDTEHNETMSVFLHRLATMVEGWQTSGSLTQMQHQQFLSIEIHSEYYKPKEH